jgi:hypothetical protein
MAIDGVGMCRTGWQEYLMAEQNAHLFGDFMHLLGSSEPSVRHTAFKMVQSFNNKQRLLDEGIAARLVALLVLAHRSKHQAQFADDSDIRAIVDTMTAIPSLLVVLVKEALLPQLFTCLHASSSASKDDNAVFASSAHHERLLKLLASYPGTFTS